MEKYDDKLAGNLLDNKWSLESFADVNHWDQQARYFIEEIEVFLADSQSRLDELFRKKAEIESGIQSKPFFARPFMIGAGLIKTIRLIDELQIEMVRVTELSEQLKGWKEATPDDQKEANEIITELKLGKKQIDINKKELQIQIKQVEAATRQKIQKIEKRILFTSPKLKRLQITQAENRKDKSTTPLEDALLLLESQELEVDKMILWYEKIKYS